jgi:hypothetical protein
VSKTRNKSRLQSIGKPFNVNCNRSMQKSGYLGDDCVLLHFLSSVIERFSSRFASLVLIFLLAYFVNPEVAGLYSWMALTLTLTQAIVEVPLRQLAPEASSSDLGRAYISLRSKYGEYVSASLLTVTFLMLLLLAPDSHTLNVWPVSYTHLRAHETG